MWRGRSHPLLLVTTNSHHQTLSHQRNDVSFLEVIFLPYCFLPWFSPVIFSLSSSDQLQHVDGSYIGDSLGPCNVGNNKKGQRWRFPPIHQICGYDESFYCPSQGWSSCLCLLKFPLHNRNIFPYKLHLLVLSLTSYKIQWNRHQIGYTFLSWAPYQQPSWWFFQLHLGGPFYVLAQNSFFSKMIC